MLKDRVVWLSLTSTSPSNQLSFTLPFLRSFVAPLWDTTCNQSGQWIAMTFLFEFASPKGVYFGWDSENTSTHRFTEMHITRDKAEYSQLREPTILHRKYITCTYMRTYVHTYIQTCRHADIQIHAFMHTCIHACIHDSYVHAGIQTYKHMFWYSAIYMINIDIYIYV